MINSGLIFNINVKEEKKSFDTLIMSLSLGKRPGPTAPSHPLCDQHSYVIVSKWWCEMLNHVNSQPILPKLWHS